MNDVELSIILPVYNEEENLKPTVELLIEKISILIRNFEIVIVDDGSKDKTYQIAKELSERNKFIRIIKHEKNLGPGSGIATGLKYVKGELITFIPADIAMDLNQFQKYIEAAKDSDVVVGVSSQRTDYSTFRKINSAVYIFLIKFLFGVRQRQFNYIHLYHRKIFEKIKVESNSVFITAEIVIKAKKMGYKISEVDINYIPRTRGSASCGKLNVIAKTFFDMILFWLKWTFYNSS